MKPTATELQRIPVIRHTQADIYAAEAQVIAAYVELHGHPPGRAFTREAAWRLLDKQDSADGNTTKESK